MAKKKNKPVGTSQDIISDCETKLVSNIMNTDYYCQDNYLSKNDIKNLTIDYENMLHERKKIFIPPTKKYVPCEPPINNKKIINFAIRTAALQPTCYDDVLAKVRNSSYVEELLDINYLKIKTIADRIAYLLNPILEIPADKKLYNVPVYSKALDFSSDPTVTTLIKQKVAIQEITTYLEPYIELSKNINLKCKIDCIKFHSYGFANFIVLKIVNNIDNLLEMQFNNSIPIEWLLELYHYTKTFEHFRVPVLEYYICIAPREAPYVPKLIKFQWNTFCSEKFNKLYASAIANYVTGIDNISLIDYGMLMV